MRLEKTNDALDVTEITPPSGIEGVEPDTEFKVTFTEPVEPSTIDENIVFVDEETQQKFDALCKVDGNIVTVKSFYPLALGCKYKLLLKSGIKAFGTTDVKGGGLNTDKSYVYTIKNAGLTIGAPKIVRTVFSVPIINNSQSALSDLSCAIAFYEDNRICDIAYTTVDEILALKSTNAAFTTGFTKAELTQYLENGNYEIYILDDVLGENPEVLYPCNNTEAARITNAPTSQQSMETEFMCDYDSVEKTVTVSGSSKTNMSGFPVLVRIVKADSDMTKDNIIRIEQIRTGKYGSVNYSFKMRDTETEGVYTAYITAPYEQNNIKLNFYYGDNNNAIQALKKLNAIAKENTLSANFNNSELIPLALDFSKLNRLTNKDIVFNSITVKAPYEESVNGANAIKKAFERALKFAELLLCEDEEIVRGILTEYQSILGITENSAFKTFRDNFSNEQKIDVAKNIKNSTDINEAADRFYAGVIIEDILSLQDVNAIVDTIKKYVSVFTVDYTDFQKIKNKEAMLTEFKNGIKDKKTTEKLKALFESIAKKHSGLDDGDDKPQNNKPSNSSGSSGSSGGSGSKGNSGIAVVKPNVVPEWYVDSEVQAEEESVFKDLENAQWAKSYINKLYKMNAITGKAEGVFAPGDNITREELCKIISVAFKLEENTAETAAGFDDVATDAWYYKSIELCRTNGVIDGIGNNLFGVGKNVTREEIATILLRASKAAGIDLDYDITVFPFADDEQISKWAKESVDILKECMIITGFEGRIFAPKDNVTRAQAAKMIVGLLEFKL